MKSYALDDAEFPCTVTLYNTLNIEVKHFIAKNKLQLSSIINNLQYLDGERYVIEETMHGMLKYESVVYGSVYRGNLSHIY